MKPKIRTVSVPDKDQDLWQRGVQVAGRRGISMSALILQSLEKELTKWEIPDAYIIEPEK
jgi:hypothetical protein